MSGRPRRVVVVGGSAAGLATVESLRREGYDGDITVVAEEPGAPYDRPPLSKEVLAGDSDPDRVTLRAKSEIEALDVGWLAGRRAVGADIGGRTIELDDGAVVPYDELVVATGLRARRPAALDIGSSGVHVLRTLPHALALRRRLAEPTRVAIVGAGFIGAEVAATAAGLGHQVSLIDPLPHPLGAVVGGSVGGFLADLHRSAGVDVRCGIGVAGIVEDDAGAQRVRLDDRSTVTTDVVVLALGSVPATEWLAGSGLDLVDGVTCDDRLAAAPGVSAVGDVARPWRVELGGQVRVEHRFNATEQAMFVARRLVHGDHGPFRTVPYFWSDQHGRRIQGYGRIRPTDRTRLVEGSLEEGRFLVAHGRGGRVTGVLGVGMPNQVRRAKTWIEDAVPWTATEIRDGTSGLAAASS